MTAPYGISIARTLLRDKIGGQLGLARQIAPSATNEIEACLGLLDGATTLNELLLIEATAANAYWQAWATIPVQFARNDLPKVPKHWLTVGNRNSRPGRTWRGASTPAHALVNYLTALAEAETRIACHAVGLDPTLGILHADKAGRESLIYDLIEPARPAVESYVLDLLGSHRFRLRDFAETLNRGLPGARPAHPHSRRNHPHLGGDCHPNRRTGRPQLHRGGATHRPGLHTAPSAGEGFDSGRPPTSTPANTYRPGGFQSTSQH